MPVLQPAPRSLRHGRRAGVRARVITGRCADRCCGTGRPRIWYPGYGGLPGERFAAVTAHGSGDRVHGGMRLPIGMPVQALAPAPRYVDHHEHGDHDHQEHGKNLNQHAAHILPKPTTRLMPSMTYCRIPYGSGPRPVGGRDRPRASTIASLPRARLTGMTTVTLTASRSAHGAYAGKETATVAQCARERAKREMTLTQRIGGPRRSRKRPGQYWFTGSTPRRRVPGERFPQES